jgi:hypothetical protein
MAEVIDLRGRKAKEQKKLKARARRRAAAVASAMSCGMCPHRCAHCGMPIEEPAPPSADVPFPFCLACFQEYQAYQRLEKGQTKPEAFWHTDQWAEMWRCWLKHMEAMEAFRRSPAFLHLMQESQD